MTEEVAARLAGALGLSTALRELYAARTVYGTFVIELATPRTVRALALGGFDFLVLDLEHSPLVVSDLPALINEAHACGVPVLVRPWSLDAGLLGKILDLGPNGLLLPHIGSAAEARAAVEATRYAPAGSRGVCPLVGVTAADGFAPGVRDDVLVILQIEGREGLAHADEIAATPHVDGVFVGPYDLSQSLGAPGEVNGTKIIAAAEKVAAAAPDGVMLGMYVDDPASSAAWAQRGFDLQCVSFDGRMLLERARDVIATATNGHSDNGGSRG